jgi:hypothetical protein
VNGLCPPSKSKSEQESEAIEYSWRKVEETQFDKVINKDALMDANHEAHRAAMLNGQSVMHVTYKEGLMHYKVMR